MTEVPSPAVVVLPHEGWAELRFNRPDRRNAMTAAMWQALHDHVQRLADRDIAALVLTGEGTTFVAGSDLRELAGRSIPEVIRSQAQRAVVALHQAPFVTIAAVNGAALGGGLEIALACDLRLSADTAVFGSPESLYSLVPAAGASRRLRKLIGHGRAMHMMITGESVDAAEALQMGLVGEVLPGSSLLPRAADVARSLVVRDPVALRALIALLRSGGGYDDASLAAERSALAVCFAMGAPRRETEQ